MDLNSTDLNPSASGRPLARRTVLAGAAALAAAVTLPGTARADSAIEALEAKHDRRIGLYAKNLRTGRELSHRPDERFALCSTFKTLAVSAALDGRLVTPDRHAQRRPVHYPPSLVAGDVWAPYTRKWFAEGYVPTFAEVCEVAVRDSDNGAANLVVQAIGGPAAVTRFVRDLGDEVTRLDRWEPDMSEYEPGQVLDTSTPRALGTSYAELILGRGLRPKERETITGWLLGNRADPPFRKGLPEGWTLADKTGSGSYATRNDVGIAWNERKDPILVSCLTRADDPEATRKDEPLTEAFVHCVEQLG
ncbi:class A beta-lactamase [Microlunatus sp. GCM10028923]|uniref:class A beta-lactamase n=1 Tax=Microlunatus sp. GCM10028923 TaxID=3273400 RepID=UPI00362204F8